jgi:hypothetical protein
VQLQLSRMVFPCLVLTFLAVLAPLTVMGADTEAWLPEAELLGGNSEAAPAPTAAGTEILVYDWNKPLASYKGRYVEGITPWQPNNTPVRNNFDWTAAPNFANGTYQVRLIIKKMRANDDFRMIFNHWQMISGKLAETNFGNNELRISYRGAPVTRTFAVAVNKFISNHTWDPHHFAPFSWKVKRDIVGFFFPNQASTPPNNKISQGAFPIDMRFTIVNVAPGHSFSGWGNYP